MTGETLATLRAVEPAALSAFDLDSAIRAQDCRFRIATGSVDLLAMSNHLPPEEFRAYIGISRELRRRNRVPNQA